ncbi:hypothetical protein HBI32_070870 [Parastagonospora nodorum]|nr:hypothetical protein HBI32_070870 [Parastagonospora nodorum]
MDFVEPPLGGEAVEVPLVTSTVMGPDDDEWLKFRNQCPFLDDFGTLDIISSQGKIAEFIQSWLYFGLLAVLSNKVITGRDFSTSGKHWSKVVSSDLVASTLVDMKLTVLRMPRDECMNALRRHKTLLVEAEVAARWVESHFFRSSSELIDLIILSVKVLIETISTSYDCAHNNMFEHLCGTSLQWYDTAKSGGDHSKAADRALESKMMENGWCLHQTCKVLSTFSYQTAYYFARLPRPRSAGLGHELCTEKSCKGWDSKPNHTNARHATETCTCPTISISSVDVAKVIRSGQIPLVSIEEDAHGSLTLKLHTRKRSSKYVAISHVWADGLGNAFENGLPACQLRMLQTYLGQISSDRSPWSAFAKSKGSTLFWMDTLCIPVQLAPPAVPFSNEDLKDIKGKAIDKMSMVYSSSSHTLVLDAEMRTIPVSADHATKLAYSQCCGWTTRSWTLQEGCLPPLTVYALADGVYSEEARRFGQQFSFKVNYAIRIAFLLLGKRFATPSLVMASRGLTPDAVARCFDFSVHRNIWTSFSTRYFSIWDTYNRYTSGRQTIQDRNKYALIWNELLDRSSSQPADTPAIFANLLGTSAYEVLKRETEQERVALIIRQQKVLPVEILFNTGPRLQERLHEQGSRLSASSQPQHLTSLGNAPEESIGLLNLSDPQTKSFRNGWVPAVIGGDRISEPLLGQHFLQVLNNCLQVYETGEERHAYMYTTAGYYLPTSKFVLNFKCQTTDDELTACARDMLIAVDRVDDLTMRSDPEESGETVMGHCFMYDPGSLLAMSAGLVEFAQGSHLVILSRSEGRATTLYSSPIRFFSISKKQQSSEGIPTIKCECNIHSSKEFVDILYDAEDLGPLLTPSSKSPGQIFLDHWIDPIAIFLAHSYISSGLRPYIGTLRPKLDTLAWFIMPLLVYLYQKKIVKRAAKQLFLEPLNDRGQQNLAISGSWTRRIRRQIDAAIVSYWSIILVGPIIDGLFFLALKGSEGKNCVIRSKLNLLVAVTYVSYWYLLVGFSGTKGWGRKFTGWYFYVLVALLCASATHDLVVLGPTTNVLTKYAVLCLNMFGVVWISRYLGKGERRRRPAGT